MPNTWLSLHLFTHRQSHIGYFRHRPISHIGDPDVMFIATINIIHRPISHIGDPDVMFIATINIIHRPISHRDMELSSRDQTNLLSRNFPSGTEENQEGSQVKIVGDPAAIRTRAS
jgi:hypothetical protein